MEFRRVLCRSSAGTAPSLTLHRALELAGAASPSLDAAAAELRAAEAGRQIAGLRPHPSLAIDAENVAGSGPYRALGGAEVTATIELPIEQIGRAHVRTPIPNANIGCRLLYKKNKKLTSIPELIQ